MHAGDKPYVVAPSGQIELASRGLTLDAVNGIVSQLLPADALNVARRVRRHSAGARRPVRVPRRELHGRRGARRRRRLGRNPAPQDSDDDRVPDEFFVRRPVSAAAPLGIASARRSTMSARWAIRAVPRMRAAPRPRRGRGSQIADREPSTSRYPDAAAVVRGRRRRPSTPEVPIAGCASRQRRLAPKPARPAASNLAPATAAGAAHRRRRVVAVAAVVVPPPVAPAPPVAPRPVCRAATGCRCRTASRRSPCRCLRLRRRLRRELRRAAPPAERRPAPPSPPVPARRAEIPLPPPVVRTAADADGASAIAPPPVPSPLAGAAGPTPPGVVLPMARSPIRSDTPPPPIPVGVSGLDRLLRMAAARGASTLYLSSHARPSVRVDGEIQMLEASRRTVRTTSSRCC